MCATFRAIALLLILQIAGCSEESPSSIDAGLLKRTFPSSIGTRWTYTYSSHAGPHDAFGGTMYDKSGKRSWVITASVLAHDSIICTIEATPQDTAREREYSYGVLIRDTTYYPGTPSQFTMVVTPDSIMTTWMATIGYSGPIPSTLCRGSQSALDTLAIVGYPASEWYVWGVGLVKYSAAHSNQTTQWNEQLTLSSFVVH